MALEGGQYSITQAFEEGMYDDEYDDTYDANEVGADDADEPVELMGRYATPHRLIISDLGLSLC